MAQCSETAVSEPHDTSPEGGREFREFIHAFSHEFDVPLRHISEFSRLLLESRADAAGSNAESVQYAEMVRSGVARLHQMHTGLLEYASLFTEPTLFVTVETEALLQETIRGLRSRFQETGAEVTIGTLPPSLHGDRRQLRMLFEKLLDNALRYHEENAKKRPEVCIDAVQQEDAPAWRFQVRDNGCGMSRDDCTAAFSPFHRLHSTMPSSAGMGLAIARIIVERHGGAIGAESTPGAGSVFYFTLPFPA